MSLVSAFFLLGPIILAAAGVVAAGALGFSRLRRTMGTAVGAVWIGSHLALLALHPPSLLLSNLLVLGTSVAAGALISRGLTSPGSVMALAIAASVADVVSFTVGPTHWLLTGSGGIRWAGLPYLAVTVPVRGVAVPMVGVGDLLLLAAFLLGLISHGRGLAISFALLAVGLLAALAVGLALGGAFGVPFMAVGVVALLRTGSRTTGAQSREAGCPA